ncbi:MAG: hypothetical protein LAO06_10260 [Acidobacteriia bacterium]|nr:hypothetical protein [Terriglobia bacterium]
MVIKILYVVLLVSMLALLWAAGACYVRVRRHLAAKHDSGEHPGSTALHGD